jgi:hypothetical protein
MALKAYHNLGMRTALYSKLSCHTNCYTEEIERLLAVRYGGGSLLRCYFASTDPGGIKVNGVMNQDILEMVN